MAKIHQSRSQLREAFEQYIADMMRKARQYHDEAPARFYAELKDRKDSYEQKQAEFRQTVPRILLTILVCVLLLGLFIMFPVIVSFIQDGVHALFTWLENALAEAMRGPMAESPSGLLDTLLFFLMGALSFIGSILLWLIHKLTHLLVYLLFYGLPLGVIVYAARQLKPPEKEYFDETFTPTEFDAEGTLLAILAALPDEMVVINAVLEGEKKALDWVNRLGDDCHVYTNLVIPFGGQESETDLIVVSPHAVTVIEVMNFQHVLHGDWSAEYLSYETTQGRRTYSHKLSNPVRRAWTHASHIHGYLHSHGANVLVRRCVLFVAPDAKLYMVKDAQNALKQCPVYHDAFIYSMLDYLKETARRRSWEEAPEFGPEEEPVCTQADKPQAALEVDADAAAPEDDALLMFSEPAGPAAPPMFSAPSEPTAPPMFSAPSARDDQPMFTEPFIGHDQAEFADPVLCPDQPRYTEPVFEVDQFPTEDPFIEEEPAASARVGKEHPTRARKRMAIERAIELLDQLVVDPEN